MAESNISELGAVNHMLLVVGEQPVNSLEASGVMEAELARNVLTEVSRSVQMEDWAFNVLNGVTLEPDRDGCIPLPHNCTKAWQPPRRYPEFIQRGNRLFNLTDRSWVFSGPVALSLRLFLQFDELIPSAAHYIVLRASRRFQEQMTGSQVTEEFLLREEYAARAILVTDDADMAGPNILWDNQPTRGAVMRDRW